MNAAGAGPAAVIDLVPTRLTSSRSAATIVYGSTVTVSGKLSRADDASGLDGEDVLLQSRRSGSTGDWTQLTAERTDADAAYSFAQKPSTNIEYRVQFPAYSWNLWPSERVVGRVMVRMKVSGAFADSTISRGTVAKFRGTVAPNHQGKTIYFQRRRSDGTWSTEKSMALTSSSSYWFSRSFSAKGTYYYRAYIPGHTDHAAGYSPVRKIVVS